MSERVPEGEPRIVYAKDLATELPDTLEQLGSRRILLICEPGRRFLDEVTGLLEAFEYQIFDQARVHVPADVVQEASHVVRTFEPDTLLSIGGGSATGLAKALRLEHDLRFVALPTTYAGSEMTTIWGMTTGSDKKTGRDPRVRPNAVVYEPRFTVELPKKLTAQSLLNALSHPVSILAAKSLEDNAHKDVRKKALDAVGAVLFALEQLAEAPTSRDARLAALRAAALAGSVLSEGAPGVHHKIAHFLGGRFDMNHAGLHSVLLPHTVASIAASDPELFAELQKAAGIDDLPAALFDLLVRADAETSLEKLGANAAALHDALGERPELPADLIQRAFLGRRPSIRVRQEDWGLADPVSVAGPPVKDAQTVVVALHGRGSNADAFIKRVFELSGDAPDIAVVAPQAPANAWYPKSYRRSVEEHGADLDRALEMVDKVVERVVADVDPTRVVLAGFSQGACLAAEYLARCEGPLGALIAFSGARIGVPDAYSPAKGRFDGMHVLLGASAHDSWVARDDVDASAEFFRAAGAEVTPLHGPGDAHELTALQRLFARERLLGRSLRNGPAGFGNAQASEALPGALPVDQNSPQPAPYGLYAEQVNATGFVAPREENKRGWLYRIRPSAQHSQLEPLDHPTFREDFTETAPEPNLVGWAPMPMPEAPADFIDGMATFGGAGGSALRRGFAVHVYAANRSMENRSFYNADGELLIVPELGRLLLQTEMGFLEVDPGMIAVIPRGLKFSVQLRDEVARGYVGETYGRTFHLPERGPVGANGLTDARHFRAPEAFFEDRLAPGYRVTAKFTGALFEATQDYSPYDVVAWHGNYTPYVYELRHFSPVVAGRFDHPDPSIFSVLSSPMDEQGAHSLDFVFFPPRWDISKGTFRPPYFHRNVVTEFNGIIRDPGGARPPFYAGGCFITPPMTAHGIRVGAVEGFLRKDDDAADKPMEFRDTSMWFQFETALAISLTPWARDAQHRIANWHHIWGAYRNHYTPPKDPKGTS